MARRLWTLATPIIGLNVLNVLALAVDTAMCGRLPDAELALSALAFAVQIVFLLMVAVIGMTVGSVALVSRAHGAGDGARVNHLLVQSSELTVLVGLTLGVLLNVVARPLLGVLGADEATATEALRYLRPLLWNTPVYYLTFLYAGVLRGVGNTRLPFQVALVANAINFFLNYGLILGNLGMPSLGIRGAAIGTVASQMFSLVALVVLIRRGRAGALTVPLSVRRIDTGLARELFKVGAPAALDMLLVNASFLFIVGMLGRIDQVAVAAHGMGLRVQALAFMPGLSVSQATAALAGQALGAGNVDLARATARASVVVCTVLMTILALLIFFLAPAIIGIFDVAPGTSMYDYTLLWMRMLGLGMPLVGTHIALMGLLQGAGRTTSSLRVNAYSNLLFQIPASAFLGFVWGMGAFGVWLGFLLGFVVKDVMAVSIYRRGDWARVGKRV